MSPYQKINILFVTLLVGLIAATVWIGVSFLYYVILFVAYGFSCAWGAYYLAAGFFLPVVSQAKNPTKKIAITFDDGPVPEKTEKILSILDQHNIKAAFFCIGSRAQSHPELLQKIDDQQHIIGNHTFTHAPTIGFFSTKKIAGELRDTNTIINTTLGKTPKFFRPPYGVTNPMIAAAVKQANYTTVGWSVRSLDTVIKDPEQLLIRVLNRIKPGRVVLFHDFCDSTITILPRFIEIVKERGYEIVRLDELLQETPYRKITT